MSDLTGLLKELCQAADHPRATVLRTMEQTGRRAVGCFPLYTPDELVYASGFLPVGMWGGRDDVALSSQYLQSFCCSVMKANMSQALSGEYAMLSAVIIPAFCDTLKCVCENWKAAIPQIPAFPMVYPQNSQSAGGKRYLEEEFRRIQEKLEGLSGRPTTELALEESWRSYEERRFASREFVRLSASHGDVITAKTRHKVIKAGYFMEVEEYRKKLSSVNEALRGRDKAIRQDETRVVVTGLLLEPDRVLDAFDSRRICIAADDLGQESRQFRIEGVREGSVYTRMAQRFCAQSGEPLLYDPKKTHGLRLIQMVKESKADGVIIAMMKFCDPEEFDYPIYKKELEQAGIPYLYLELEQSMIVAGSIDTGLDAFIEMIHN